MKITSPWKYQLQNLFIFVPVCTFYKRTKFIVNESKD